MRVLFLSTWFPYPLNIGSKIRAYHLIRALAERHAVALVSFADAPVAPEWVAGMRHFCARVEVVGRDPFAADPGRRWQSRLSLAPRSVVATYAPEMAELVWRVAREWRPDALVAHTFVTAPYAMTIPGIPKVLDADNVMTSMFRDAYQRAHRRGERWRRWLTWWKFQRYEKAMFRQFDLTLIASPREREDAAASLLGPDGRAAVVPNGVDTLRNRPGIAEPTPNTLIYNGALSYSANYDAMDYFLRETFPLIRAELPEAHLRITGRTDNAPMSDLKLNDHVMFTGYLDDVRPAVAGSAVCVVPLRIGSGTRLKILEAMALGTPVVSTSKGAEGLEVEAGKHLLLADTPEAFAAQTLRVLRDPELRQSLSRNARQLVEKKYDWAGIGERFVDLVEDMGKAKRGGAVRASRVA